ncbi:MAG TPA: VWA domain-containing protein [Acidimicrobiales bacterium]|nr:VWA domain-containing protein [Acidimicrobiales bacterium]
MPAAFRYSRWDGTQTGFDLDADDVLSELSDDVLYHGDIDAALRRLLQSGLNDRDGRHLDGLRELVERLRERRREDLERNQMGGLGEDVARELREILEEERGALDARSGYDADADVEMARRRLELDLLPPDLAGQLETLTDYDFFSKEAARRFDELVERLREQVVTAQFDQMAGALSSMTPEQRARMAAMLAGLNRMLDQRENGEEPNFAEFMATFGDFFPGNPQDLDELLEQVTAQLAAQQALLNSMTAEQRAELESLAAELFADLDMQWQADQLGRRLQSMFPQAGWSGGVTQVLPAAPLMDRLGRMDQLEQLLGSALSPGALSEVDPETARDLLGPEGGEALARLAELARVLKKAGLIDTREGRLELTPRGLRALGQKALRDLFSRLAKDRLGHHPVEAEGPGHERADDTKPYEYGAPFNLNIERTLRNALLRRGGGVPVRLEPGDFEIDRTEARTRTSTVLLLDLSFSMALRDNFVAAKKVALALHTLISGSFPSDHLAMIGFSEVARPLRPEELPEVSWDYGVGTNMHHALALARKMLSGRGGSRQVVMITDGEPTAHVLDDGEVFFQYPPAAETIEATLDEVLRCTRAGIRINTFMLDATPALQAFVQRVSKLNRGRVFLATPATLGDYVLIDFLDQKRT